MGAILAICCLSGSALAQNSNAGDIRGTVTDSSGAVVPSAKVVIVNTDTSVSTVVFTNSSGIYDAVSLLPGSYTLTFSKSGFKTFVRKGVDLSVQVLTINAQLTVGATSQHVQVVGHTSLLKTETSEQGSTLGSKTMAQLPNVGLNWLNFTKILPGVTGQDTGVSVNGSGLYQSNWLSDGGTMTLPHSQNIDSTGIFESIAEVKVDTSTYDAQYGNGSSVFNQITKSGTNQFHGAVYEYDQNDFFNARSFFANKVSNLRHNQFGAALGGPIKKNKLFFFFNYEKILTNSAYPGYYTFPTAAMRQGNFSNPAFPQIYDPATLTSVNGQYERQPFSGNVIPSDRIDPVAAKIQSYLPMPNRPGLYNNYYQQLVNTVREPRYFGRLDYNISSANRLTGSIKYQDDLNFSPAPTCPMDCVDGNTEGLTGEITDVWTFGPSVVNELHLDYVRQGNWYVSPNIGQGFPQKIGLKYALANMFPDVYIGGPVGATSITGGTHAVLVEDSFDPSDVVTMIKGKHILKFGGEFQALQDNGGAWGDIHSAGFYFGSVFTAQAPFASNSGLGYADFLLGQVDSWFVSESPETGTRQKNPQMFIQDAYKIKPNLTLNLGLRYQIQNGWSEVYNRLASFDPSLTNPSTNTAGAMWWAGSEGRTSLQAPVRDILLPRLGFAWSPQRKWSVRGGFGVYANMWGSDQYANNAKGVGFASSGSLTNTDSLEPVFILSDPNPPLNLYVPGPNNRQPQSMNGQSVPYYPYHTPVAKVYQWSFDVQRQLGTGMVAELAYVASHGANLMFPMDLNQVPQNRLGPGNAQPRRPYPQFQSINGDLYNGISNYDSLQVSFRKRFTSGLTYDLNYTWSKSLVDQSGSGWGGQAGAQDWQIAADPGANYGLSNFDRAQMFKGDVVYQLPIGEGKAFLNRSGLVNDVVGGWQTSAIFVIESGAPFTPVMGTQNLTGSLAGSWYPNRIGSGTLPNPSIQQWFNTSAFVQPAQFTFGNSGRDILRGPGMVDFDLSAAKNFRISKLGEGGRLQLRLDATNGFNHPNFANPNSQIGTPGAGIISSTALPGRTIQIGAKLSF